jgi:acetolactate decarboxylase
MSANCATCRGRWWASASPDPLSGIEILGAHLHFADDQRRRGGHVLDYTVRDVTVQLDDATDLHVELPAAVGEPEATGGVDQAALRRLEHTD